MIRDHSLCLECGLCCNGVLFARGELGSQDPVLRLQTLGLRVTRSSRNTAATVRFRQPCAALDGCRCRIYSERPEYCRAFECLVLKRLASGALSNDRAAAIVRSARRRAQRVRRLLVRLNDSDETTALGLRFRRVQKRLEAACPDSETAAVFSELTLAMSDLNRFIRDQFLGD